VVVVDGNVGEVKEVDVVIDVVGVNVEFVFADDVIVGVVVDGVVVVHIVQDYDHV